MALKRQRAFLQTTQAVPKRSKLAGSMAMSRSLTLSQAQKSQVEYIVRKNEEVKFIDGLQNPVGVDVLGQTTVLFAPPSGGLQSQRLGQEVRLLSIACKIALTPGDTTNFVRVIIWQYKQNSALSTPTNSTILGPGQTGGVINFVSPYNYLNKKIYKILHDKTYDLSSQGTPCLSDNFRIKVPKKNQLIEMSSTDNNGTGLIYLTVISDSAAAPNPTLQGTYRHFYQDS